MVILRKIRVWSFAFLVFIFLALPNVSFATDDASRATVLPSTELTQLDCEKLMDLISYDMGGAREAVSGRTPFHSTYDGKDYKYTDILSCAVKTGDVSFWMVLYFVRWILEFVIGLAGIASVGGVIYGGYLYLFSGFAENADNGKNAIKNSIIGLVLTLTAWGIVNIVLSFLML